MNKWNIWPTLAECGNTDRHTDDSETSRYSTPLNVKRISPKDSCWYLPASTQPSSTYNSLKLKPWEAFQNSFAIVLSWNSDIVLGRVSFTDKLLQINGCKEHVLYIEELGFKSDLCRDVLELISYHAKSSNSYSYFSGNTSALKTLGISEKDSDLQWT